MNAEPIQVTIEIAKILDALKLPYFVSGSLAIGIHGIARATMDVDIVVALDVLSVASFVAALGDDFYRMPRKTHLQHILIALGLNLVRAVTWIEGERPEQTRSSPFVLLFSSSPG